MIVAQDIMTESVVVVHEKKTVSQVAHLMLRERVSGYPVVDDDHSLVGIVTITDLFVLVDQVVISSSEDKTRSNLRELSIEDIRDRVLQFKDKPVSEIMSKEVYTISPETPLNKIISDVIKLNIHTFPVVKKNQLVGIIGRHDILNAFFTYS